MCHQIFNAVQRQRETEWAGRGKTFGQNGLLALNGYVLCTYLDDYREAEKAAGYVGRSCECCCYTPYQAKSNHLTERSVGWCHQSDSQQ